MGRAALSRSVDKHAGEGAGLTLCTPGSCSQQFSAPDCFPLRGAWEGGSQPCTEKNFEDWLKDLTHWRAERKIRIGYGSQRYELPAFQWTQSAFIQPQMMVQDRYFYDPVAGKYTVDRYLDDLEQRFGGIDAVLIWPTYPNMGIDNRNQHDMIRSMPGGIPGVRKMVETSIAAACTCCSP